MVNINKHKFFLLQILKDIYSDIELASCLGFKGGTALMFFYDLPRFSVDLDFNLLDITKEKIIYEKVRRILLKYGKIYDEAMKFYGPIIVLDYGVGERKLKVEISNRQWSNHYEIKNLLGINMKVMVASDMFAHKLCAMLDRNEITNRDIFDTWFFMNNRTAINKAIVEERIGMTLAEYIQQCIEQLEAMSDKGMLNGLGELMDEDMKRFVRTKLRTETVSLLKFYKEFPVFLE
ncbi:nucleotidyl transferase AbiEii/AbiGii toxin family protein [uncultured Bacteroides sp.]|uniref:nucleotidyl transferase AbiEii/AbiGii toxin family protein n=1 Tax=uncultured Bacteroides sp. TaxID=162156 RepID=UPI002AA74FA6|nr:nucleotidyl transferase AbiEii/AbiGii toxin family protein [uncultured Bacteroides sp.]